MFDPVHNQLFLLGLNPESKQSYWWDGGEPIWVTAEKQVSQYLSGAHITKNPNFDPISTFSYFHIKSWD